MVLLMLVMGAAGGGGVRLNGTSGHYVTPNTVGVFVAYLNDHTNLSQRRSNGSKKSNFQNF